MFSRKYLKLFIIFNTLLLIQFIANANADPPIVQPTWTQSKQPEKVNANDFKVVVTAEKLRTAAAIREQIKLAVDSDVYVASANDARPKDAGKIMQLYGTREKGKGVLGAMLGTADGNLEAEMVTSTFDEDLGGPNIITANVAADMEIDVRKLQKLEVSKRRTREVLVLKYIEEDFSFDLGDGVHEWEHIIHAGQEYFIGRRSNDLYIVRKDADKYEPALVVNVGQYITYIESYTYWSVEKQMQEGIILIATQENVLWYRADEKTKQMELYWEWMVGNFVTGLTYFTLDGKNFLAVSTNQSSLAGYYALNIYEFVVDTKEFWIAQRLQLQHPCDEVTILNTGRDIILAVPQNDTAAIYAFNPREFEFSHIRFQLKKTIEAEGILTISAFKMGGNNYLALSGHQPQILLYQQGEFISKTILGHNFGLVEMFFPIAVRTYRDDLILLVQHRVDFVSHFLTVVETLIWNGDSFEVSIPVPCHMGQQVVYGVGCMLDIQRDEGLKGAALLRRNADIYLIVPRNQAESGLFRFHTELLSKNSEVFDLQEIFDFLKQWVSEQDNFIAAAQQFLNTPDEQILRKQPNLSNLEILKTPEIFFGGEVGEIYVNDHKWTQQDANIDLDFVIRSIEDLELSLTSGRQRRQLNELYDLDMPYPELNFDEVYADVLEVEEVNGIPYEIQNAKLSFDGAVNTKDFEVLDEIVRPQKRQLEEDFLLDGDLEFDFINGLPWSEIKNNLIFRNQPVSLEHLQIDGKVVAEDSLNIDTLNTLQFPEDFLLSSGPAFSVVKAKKDFKNRLSVHSVDTNGVINGKHPVEAITLNDPQVWNGLITFKQLEVKEKLELKGDAYGRNVNNFPENPTLQESKILDASCVFNDLVVTGPLILKGNMNEQPLGPLLKDVALKVSDPNTEILIDSPKSFDLVMFPVDFEITDEKINQIEIEEFLTVHTNQTLNISRIDGYVYFYNLTLNGSFDGVNVDDLIRDGIMLNKMQDLSNLKVNFNNATEFNSLRVTKKLNNIADLSELQTTKEDLLLLNAEFKELEAQQAEFSSDILGSGKLNYIELHKFVNERSWQKQDAKANLFINEMVIDGEVNTDELHGIKSEYLMDFLKKVDELPDMVLNGQIQVEQITVTGDVLLNKLNGQRFDDDIQLTAVWLNKPIYLSTNLTFTGNVQLQKNLNVLGDFNGQYLPDIIEDIIIRSPKSPIVISAPKSFLSSIQVLQDTNLQALNGVAMQNFGFINRINEINGSLTVRGNVFASNIELAGLINNSSFLHDMKNSLYYDYNLEDFVLKGQSTFQNQLYLNDLTVLQHYNDIMNLDDFFDSIIIKNSMCLLEGKNTFTGRVSIEQGAYINNLNGHELNDLFKNIVFIHGSRPVIIRAPVKFIQPVIAQEISIKNALKTSKLNNCSIQQWLNDTLRVDQDENVPYFLQFSAGSLDGNALRIHYVNDIDMSKVMTLNSAQNFDFPVNIKDVHLEGFIQSKGKVNDMNLEEEYNNTLMTYGNQHVLTPLTIQSIAVLRDLEIKSFINSDKNLSDVASLENHIELESTVYFQSLYAPQIKINGFVNGMDIEKFFQTTVHFQGRPTQYITGNWSVKSLTVKTGPNNFEYMINGYEPWQYSSYIRNIRSDSDTEEHVDKALCESLNHIWNTIRQQEIFLKYVEEAFEMNIGNSTDMVVRKSFHLQQGQQNELLINTGCITMIFKWLANEMSFVYVNQYESGPVDEVIILPNSKNSSDIQFITTFESENNLNCSLQNLKLRSISNKTNEDALVSSPKVKKATSYSFEYFFMHTLPPSSAESTTAEGSVSILKPTNSSLRHFTFNDFKDVVLRILMDLQQRLNMEVNITQLSIPESDLFDENLIPDFIALLNELNNQQIFSKDNFTLDFENITVPQNPAQVLAARVVQITWPAILEIEEIHSYLRKNVTHNHPLCSCISHSLGALVYDVLNLANHVNSSSTPAELKAEEDLYRIIERIRLFEKELQEYLLKLKHQDVADMQKNDDILLPSGTNIEPKMFSFMDIEAENWNNSNASWHHEEFLTLQVGALTNRYNISIAIKSKHGKNIDATQQTGLYIYQPVANQTIFQFIPSENPHSLIPLHIKQETLLFYIENCCHIHILRYAGVEGFKSFAQLAIGADIKQLLTLTLPDEKRMTRYYLAVVLSSKLKFYEIKLDRIYKQPPPDNSSCIY